MKDGTQSPKPGKIIARRLKKKGDNKIAELLVKWKDTTEEDATWVDLDELRQKFPDLEGKVF